MVRGLRTTAVTVPHPAKKKEKETGMVVTIPGGILAMVKGEKVGKMEKARVVWDGKVGRGRGRRGKAREGGPGIRMGKEMGKEHMEIQIPNGMGPLPSQICPKHPTLQPLHPAAATLPPHPIKL